MRPVKFDAGAVLAPFYSNKVLSKEQHLQLCGCSVMTAWRLMNEHGYLSSYNFNAKYYTLVDIPRFDKNGLWSYRNIRFSRFGSLPCTMTELVKCSSSGMNAGEIEQVLGISNARTTLARLSKQGRLSREKIRGRLVYFSSDSEHQQQQRDRFESARQTALLHAHLPEPDRIIALLVERIQRPRMDTLQLARRMARKGFQITPEEIEAVFIHYKLQKKSPRIADFAQ